MRIDGSDGIVMRIDENWWEMWWMDDVGDGGWLGGDDEKEWKKRKEVEKREGVEKIGGSFDSVAHTTLTQSPPIFGLGDESGWMDMLGWWMWMNDFSIGLSWQ